MSISDELQKLADLHSSGALTDAEYQAAKGQLLGMENDLLALDPEGEGEGELDSLEPFEEDDGDNLELGIEPDQFTRRRNLARSPKRPQANRRRLSIGPVVAILICLISLIVTWKVSVHREEEAQREEAEQLSRLDIYLSINDTYYARVALRKLEKHLSVEEYQELENRVSKVEEEKDRRRAAPPTTGLACEVVDEKVYDAPIKTQVERRLVVPLSYGSDQLHQVLNEQFREVRGLRGFEHHGRPTNVYLYAHHTKESAASGGDRWIAMLSFSSYSDIDPNISVNEDRIAALREKPTKSLGLDESTRKKVFYELVAAEHSASAAAARKYPKIANVRDLEERVELEEKLLVASRSELAKKYGYNEGDWGKIAVEGITKGWPGPPR